MASCKKITGRATYLLELTEEEASWLKDLLAGHVHGHASDGPDVVIHGVLADADVPDSGTKFTGKVTF